MVEKPRVSSSWQFPCLTEAAREVKDRIASVVICRELMHREGNGRDGGERLVSALRFYCSKGVGVDVDAG